MEDSEHAGLYWGWEAPTCQLRGHFTGHWMSAAAMLTAVNGDYELKAKLDKLIDELEKCQELNHNGWLGSIPEKFFDKLEREEYIWSPQYVMHKTVLGLMHAYQYAGNSKALVLLDKLSDWYMAWTAKMAEVNPHAVYGGEEGGMLEVWATLYELTGNDKYKELADRYSNPSLFRKLLEGKDALTNCHENASIPWAHGAAKMYEVTGEEKWRTIVELFWKNAVTDRGEYCTGAQGAGEYWVPPHMQGQFLCDRNQEFCTVYNMVRLADYLYRFTGDTAYADYIERNLYNGFLAQQHKEMGTPTYFLPMKPGSKKKWGTKTRDFWCCHGTMVQSQTLYPSLCYYRDEAVNRLVVGQYIPSEVCFGEGDDRVEISQCVDMKYYNAQAFFDEKDDSQMSRWLLKFTVRAKKQFTLAFRVPGWVAQRPVVKINGEELTELTLAELPDMPEMAAVLEGPIVLAGLCDVDKGLYLKEGDIKKSMRPKYEYTYSVFPWKQSTYQTTGQP